MNIVKHWQQFHFRINVPRHKYAVFNLHSVSLARIKRACVQPALISDTLYSNMTKRHAALTFGTTQQLGSGEFT